MKMIGKYDGWNFTISDGGVTYWRDGEPENVQFAEMGMDGAAIAMMGWLDTQVRKDIERGQYSIGTPRVSGTEGDGA